MKYFIIIDMQNDFITGALKNDSAKSKIPGIVEKAKELKAKGYTIVATRDTHTDNYLDSQEGKNLPVPHCIKGTSGWEVVDEIKDVVDVYVDKPSFGYANWEEFFKASAEAWTVPEEIQMCGTCTGICVASNFAVLKATYPETPIAVYKDLCACLTEDTHNAAITVMKTQQAIIL